MTVRLRRDPWADDVELPDEWDVPFELVKHPIGVKWSHSELFPCDADGFRIPPGFRSVQEKYDSSEGRPRVFCFGGSTTFGWYCSYEETYPHHLEQLLENRAVFNFGIGGADSKRCFQLFVELLRRGYVPDVVVFLDGINEKQGWLQARAGNENYEEVDSQYEYFRVRFEDARGAGRAVGDQLARLRRRAQRVDVGGGDDLRFVGRQAASYLNTRAALHKVAETYGVTVVQVLQPTLWDVYEMDSGGRAEYMKALYRLLLAKTDGKLSVLSERKSFRPEMFFDWQHLNGSGNKRVAEAVCDWIA